MNDEEVKTAKKKKQFETRYLDTFLFALQCTQFITCIITCKLVPFMRKKQNPKYRYNTA